jgi:uncharacterized protein YcbK (DUF882 family)
MYEPKYFKRSEFACSCCGEVFISDKLLQLLDEARGLDYIKDNGIKFIINSGYRCQKHNAEVGGKSESAHTEGLAADIKVTGSRNRFLILKALMDVGFNRIGIAKTFIHCDIDGNKDPYVVWLY